MTPRRLLLLAAILAGIAAAAFFVWRSEQPAEPEPSPLADSRAESIVRVEFSGRTSAKLRKESGMWRVEEPADPADDAGVEQLLADLRDFTVGTVLSENAARHAQYELNEASATRVRVFLEGEEAPDLDVFVGKATADLESSYIRFPGDDRVRSADGLSSFRIHTNARSLTTSKVLPFPAADIEALGVRFAQGETSLVKSSDTWTDAGTGKPVNAEWMARLLSVLDGWRADDAAASVPARVDWSKPALRLNVTRRGQAFPVDVSAPGLAPAGAAQRFVRTGGRATVLLVSNDGVIAVLDALKPPR